METQKLPLTKDELTEAVHSHLANTEIANLILASQITTLPDGSIDTTVIINLKTMMKLASEKAPQVTMKEKFKAMENFLEPYA